MPVLVTAAESSPARHVVERLLDEGGEVRAVCHPRGDVGHLRQRGAFVAVGAPDDVGLLEAAMEGAHTVVHVGGGLLSPSREAIEAGTAAMLAAATNAGVSRIIALSLPGATVDADDDLRRAKARDERRLREAPPPTVVVRASLVDSSGLRDALAGAEPDPDVLERTVAPLRREDLVELIAALDAARSRATEGHVVFAADGAREMSLADYLEAAGVGLPGAAGRRLGHRYWPPETIPLLADGLDGPWVNDDDRLVDAWEFTELEPQPIAGGP